ncbi:hypothetical protein TCAL_06006 [Tigriopus californicus]|uniref:MSP domain-containing protein n=1 Tax=Tigriopus californicus TaxID=6832 RepID=A0A553PQW0_TIGCA|nr:vesicle-associated membrane protein-associated protein B-like [Tigriopus californicus]TRY80060.1 hypothetical protein TCAL_06006 [Tigriopus californicus]|eukprot:TCALIF_06006-PA protein Name:"Similar to Vapb Vesicle-associated membrane protein-associated protein B (Rattus norvegicus)" AED:0.00 eAED:0.00 QI:209/1/1/1/1/1/2/2518/266
MANADSVSISSFPPKELVVDWEPDDQIVFSGDFRSFIKSELTIKNRSLCSLLFKIKTTSPNRYLVSPHKGRIEPKRYMVITITLLPFLYKPERTYGDKFLIQICKESLRNEQCAKHNFWSMIPEHEVLQKKIRCNLQFSVDSPTDSEDENFPFMPDTATATPAILVSLPNGRIINPFDQELASRRKGMIKPSTPIPAHQEQPENINPTIQSQEVLINGNPPLQQCLVQTIQESNAQEWKDFLMVGVVVAIFALGIILGKGSYLLDL